MIKASRNHKRHILLSLLITFFLPSQTFAQTTEEVQCQSEVQGKVPWSQGGSSTWNPANVQKLCKGVIRPAERIGCFQKGILAHNNWSKAIEDCAATGGGASTEVISGKQCIYNKGGYALGVDWYNPGLIVFNGGDASDYSNYTSPGTPYSSESITLGKSSCTDAANRSAVVRIVGHDVANAAITVAAGTVTGITSGVLGAFACVGTAGVGCPAAAAAVGAATTGAISAVGAALPNVAEIAYIGVPGSQNYLDFYGTVWKVGISSEVPLGQKRKPITEAVEYAAAGIRDFVTGGTPGPKSITFNNQAGYVSEMIVMYHENRNVGGRLVPMPVVKSSGNVSLGFSKHIDIPINLANIPIVVSMNGVGTTTKSFFSISIPADFSGNKCFKSWGTIFDAKGGACN